MDSAMTDTKVVLTKNIDGEVYYSQFSINLLAERISELEKVVLEMDKYCMKLKNTLEGFHFEDCVATNLEMDDDLECDCGTQKVVDDVVIYLDKHSSLIQEIKNKQGV